MVAEVDAMPGGYVCSASFKDALGPATRSGRSRPGTGRSASCTPSSSGPSTPPTPHFLYYPAKSFADSPEFTLTKALLRVLVQVLDQVLDQATAPGGHGEGRLSGIWLLKWGVGGGTEPPRLPGFTTSLAVHR